MFGRKTPRTPASPTKVETVIGEHAEIKGEIHSKGVVRVDGLLQGTVDHQGHLIIGPSGRLIANVKAVSMAVAGEIRGDVEVQGVLELLEGARMVGDVRCGHLVIHAGATFQGRSSMLDARTVAPESVTE
jgi:cytoskeletal protein CcmA (bactofilin family)